MKVSMARTRAYFRQHISLASIKKIIAQKFGFKVKTNEQVEAKIPNAIEPDASLTHSKPITSRQTKKAKPSVWVNWRLARSKKQSRKIFSEMLQNWMSDKPEKAVQSLVKLHSQIEKTMKLEKHGMMAADDYADKAESVLMDFISFLTVDEKYNIKRNLRPGGKIYRGLSAVLFVQDGKDAKDEFMRNYLSDKAKSCISFTGPVHQLLFDKLFPVEAKQYKDQVMDETNPFRTDLSEQEVNDIKAAFFALEKVK